MTEKEIIEVIDGRENFLKLLEHNPGLVIIKFGAKWCNPCKKIKPLVDAFFATSPPDVMCIDLDVDVDGNDKVYGFLHSKKMVNGLPTILCYKKKNLPHEQITFIPDDSIIGASLSELDAFFARCGKHLEHVKTLLPRKK